MVTATQEDLKKVTTYLPAGLWQRVRIRALELRISVGAFVAGALIKELDGNKPKRP